MFKWIKNIGPGTLVAAAFIGPGTVTICTKAGVQFGYGLLWAMLLSIIATIVLQEMAARTGIVTQKGLAEVIKSQMANVLLRNLAIFLILGAIVIGNAAYEAGNISGAALGMQVFGKELIAFYPILIGCIAFMVLFIGNYKILERSLVALVLVMSISFLITAILTKPDILAMLKGTFIPTIPENSIFIIIGLIGTTVVPYNLFLHASLVKEKWKTKEDLASARKDTFISIILGGIVSMAIIVAATATTNGNIANAFDLAKGLEPLYGEYAKYLLGIGLFAAGITSAITAPLAAAYVAKSCFGWKGTLKDYRFRIVWAIILVLGVVFSSLQFKPVEVITFAQVANGLLLPIVAIFLVWIVNKTTILGSYKNTLFQNILAITIILIAIMLGIKGIYVVF
ncbi:NRAMP (natural resistance-associated macrophage protein)-like metal ion transporter [Kordia periserrulae]|uniref:NRAMP (Natural resistance-associated macrophage protein)-like metal ion transporter n=1 Tax=Kordia periserrulae TaxID=701523 RepID=A0A2T6BZA4_9FLAO|nr:Nramp family divalent metal transporter [Kordia periserrulae]PTX61389.1 NRAMP (natural resistance-associated macrophage protein)-like metal ion transporter [Kordia periserrulae]